MGVAGTGGACGGEARGRHGDALAARGAHLGLLHREQRRDDRRHLLRRARDGRGVERDGHLLAQLPEKQPVREEADHLVAVRAQLLERLVERRAHHAARVDRRAPALVDVLPQRLQPLAARVRVVEHRGEGRVVLPAQLGL
eukprot:1874769-Prymnesium_polylepis.1